MKMRGKLSFCSFSGNIDSDKSRKHYGMSYHVKCDNYVKSFTCMSACKSIGFQVFRMDHRCKCSCHELKTTTILPFFKWLTNGTTMQWHKTRSVPLYNIVGTLSPPTYPDYSDHDDGAGSTNALGPDQSTNEGGTGGGDATTLAGGATAPGGGGDGAGTGAAGGDGGTEAGGGAGETTAAAADAPPADEPEVLAAEEDAEEPAAEEPAAEDEPPAEDAPPEDEPPAEEPEAEDGRKKLLY